MLRFKSKRATSSVVERVTDNDEVEGSIPSSPTTLILHSNDEVPGFGSTIAHQRDSKNSKFIF